MSRSRCYLKLRFRLQELLAAGFLPGIIPTRRVSEGQMREDLKSDATSSLAYASGCDCCEMRNFQNCATRYSISAQGLATHCRTKLPSLKFQIRTEPSNPPVASRAVAAS
jgi:hypothetical protein